MPPEPPWLCRAAIDLSALVERCSGNPNTEGNDDKRTTAQSSSALKKENDSSGDSPLGAELSARLALASVRGGNEDVWPGGERPKTLEPAAGGTAAGGLDVRYRMSVCEKELLGAWKRGQRIG